MLHNFQIVCSWLKNWSVFQTPPPTDAKKMLRRFHLGRPRSPSRWTSTVTLRWADGREAGAFLPKYLRENTMDTGRPLQLFPFVCQLKSTPSSLTCLWTSKKRTWNPETEIRRFWSDENLFWWILGFRKHGIKAPSNDLTLAFPWICKWPMSPWWTAWGRSFGLNVGYWGGLPGFMFSICWWPPNM